MPTLSTSTVGDYMRHSYNQGAHSKGTESLLPSNFNFQVRDRPR